MMSTNASHKITDTHRAKLAYVYIRQSTAGQLVRHSESTRRQYELVDRAVALGWPAPRVHVIDEDLAKSGAHADQRFGFQHLLGELSLGHVGLVLSLEATRLSRNSSDWYRLLELSSIFGVLIADAEFVYDPHQYHDRLLLGLAGMMSEAELHHLHLRMQEGRRHKAERGALRLPLPAGLERLDSGEVVLHTDEEVQSRLHVVFEIFERLGSARAVAQYLRRHHLTLPTRPHRGPSPLPIVWVEAKTNGVLNILQNPAYAGTYAWGKSTTDPTRRKPGVPHSGVVERPIEQWSVCLFDAYPAYITWEQFLANRQRLYANQYGPQVSQAGAARMGDALLQGMAWCGRCGARLWVRYRGARGHRPGYVCNAAATELGEPRCQEVSAADVDPAVAQMVLQALEPDKVELALEAFDQFERDTHSLERQWQLKVERARYEAQRAQRQYDTVEPENRLVARNLEKHWEEKLRAVEEVEREYAQWQSQRQTSLSPADRQAILSLGQNLPALWDAATTTPADRKRIIRLVMRDVILDRTRAPEKVWLQINWQTGATTQHWVDRPVKYYREQANVESLRQRLTALKADGLTDQVIADRLYHEGYSTTQGTAMTRGAVWYLRRRWQIGSARQERRQGTRYQWPDGRYTLNGVAELIGVHVRTVLSWIERGMIVADQAYKGGPLKMALSPEQIDALRRHVAQVRRPRRPPQVGHAVVPSTTGREPQTSSSKSGAPVDRDVSTK